MSFNSTSIFIVTVLLSSVTHSMELFDGKNTITAYIKKAKENRGKEPIVRPLEQSIFRKWAFSMSGLVMASSFCAYKQGYASLESIIKYPLTITAILVCPFAFYNWHLNARQKEWETNTAWYNNLKTLEKIDLKSQQIEGTNYFFSKKYDTPKAHTLNDTFYEFYVMPTDADLIKAFTIINYAFQKTENQNHITYIAIRPTPGVTRTAQWPLGHTLPRIIVSTDLKEKTGAQNASAILHLLKNQLTHHNIQSIRTQPSFSYTTATSDLIYWSPVSFTHNCARYNNAPTYFDMVRMSLKTSPTKKEVNLDKIKPVEKYE